jgi:hypothetical protein
MTLLTCGDHDSWAGALGTSIAPLRHVRLGDDATVDDEWTATCGLGADGALLVRPDQHIAWRAEHLPPDPAGALTTALAQALRVA